MVDLTLLVTSGDRRSLLGNAFATTVLDLECMDTPMALWDEIGKLPLEKAYQPFKSYVAPDRNGFSRYGIVSIDAYGRSLQWVEAGDLKRFRRHRLVKHNAAWAYLAALPPETMVALYWH